MAAKKKLVRKKLGRKRIETPSLAAALADVDALGFEESARKHGVGERTLRRRHAEATVQEPVNEEAMGAEGSAEQLALVRRILGKRDPAALAELDAGLLEAAKGEAALVTWLERPLVRREVRDPLDAVVEALAAASAYVDTLKPDSPRAATILTAVSTLAARVENIGKGRPKAETEDQATARLRGVRDVAVARMLPRIEEARTKLHRERADLITWARTNLGPLIAAELERRVSGMLGEAVAA